MSDETPTITIVDDDDSLRRALARLLSASGYHVRTFASASELLSQSVREPLGPGCLVVDVRMPDVNGLQLQAFLKGAGLQTAVVFMTGHSDVQTGVTAMKSGAVDFLLKPFTDEDLLDAVHRALYRDAELRLERREIQELEKRAARLTRREHEVCALVVAGKLNKQIAAALGTSEKTVKVHRARVMAKMQVASLAELVSTVERLNRAHARDHANSPTSPAPGYRHEAGENGHVDARRSAS